MIDKHNLYGLAYGCPYLNRKNDCPFMQVEHLTFMEKVNWIDGLNEDIKQKIIEEHKNCLKDRV